MRLTVSGPSDVVCMARHGTRGGRPARGAAGEEGAPAYATQTGVCTGVRA